MQIPMATSIAPLPSFNSVPTSIIWRPMVSSITLRLLNGDPWYLLRPHLLRKETHGIFYDPTSLERRPMVSSTTPTACVRRPIVSSTTPLPLKGDPWYLLRPHRLCKETHCIFYDPTSLERRPMVSSMTPLPLKGGPWCLLLPHCLCKETHGIFYDPTSCVRRPMVSSIIPPPLLHSCNRRITDHYRLNITVTSGMNIWPAIPFTL